MLCSSNIILCIIRIYFTPGFLVVFHSIIHVCCILQIYSINLILITIFYYKNYFIILLLFLIQLFCEKFRHYTHSLINTWIWGT